MTNEKAGDSPAFSLYKDFYSFFLEAFFSSVVFVVTFFTVSAFLEVSAPIFMPVSFLVVSAFTVVSTLVVEDESTLVESELELELLPLHAAKEKHTAAARNDALM